MKLTPKEVRLRENAIFDALENASGDGTFRGCLYRDGVPTPEAYMSQRIGVLFAFRDGVISESVMDAVTPPWSCAY